MAVVKFVLLCLKRNAVSNTRSYVLNVILSQLKKKKKLLLTEEVTCLYRNRNCNIVLRLDAPVDVTVFAKTRYWTII